MIRSERVSKSGVVGERLKEAQHINKSLSALGNVVSSLVAKNNHIPYRDSKLTFFLKDSLGGDSKTLMFVNLSPAIQNANESMCSLNFAARVRNVELGPAKKNIDDNSVLRAKEDARKALESAKAKDKDMDDLQEKLRQSEEKYSRLEQLYNQLVERMLKRDREPSKPTVAQSTQTTTDQKLNNSISVPKKMLGLTTSSLNSSLPLDQNEPSWTEKVLNNRPASASKIRTLTSIVKKSTSVYVSPERPANENGKMM
jgi:kinesin family protein C2/C3